MTEKPLPKTGGITRTYRKTLARRQPGARSLAAPHIHLVLVERWRMYGIERVRVDPKALCGVVVTGRELDTPAASCPACKRIFANLPGPGDCPGSAKRWIGGTGAPVCPGCHRGPASLAVRRPRMSAAKWWGIVPRHEDYGTWLAAEREREGRR
jgi:hypothetical protein